MLSAQFGVLLENANLSPTIKTNCNLGLKVIGILYLDLAYRSGLKRLYHKEFDSYFTSLPDEYFYHRDLISLEMVANNVAQKITAQQTVLFKDPILIDYQLWMVNTKLTAKEYKAIFERMSPQLCAFGYRFLQDRETTKDIVQDIFLRVWKNKTVFTGEKHIIGYLYKCVKYNCYNHLRSKHHKNTEPYDLAKLKTYDTEEFFMAEAVAVETSVLVEKAINTLTVKGAQVIRLSIQGCRNKEIAEEMAISVNTVKDHKKKAYHELRILLGTL